MARKSKKGSKSSKAKKKLPAFIGVVSSIDLSPEMKSAFEAGVGAYTVHYKPNVKYKKKALRKAIRDYNDDNDCKLIVTVGGLVVWEAANSVLDKQNDKPFVSLIGAKPDDPSDPFFAGVSVQELVQTRREFQGLIGKGFDRNEICLLYNPNSEQRNKELGEWKGANPVPAGSIRMVRMPRTNTRRPLAKFLTR